MGKVIYWRLIGDINVVNRALTLLPRNVTYDRIVQPPTHYEGDCTYGYAVISYMRWSQLAYNTLHVLLTLQPMLYTITDRFFQPHTMPIVERHSTQNFQWGHQEQATPPQVHDRPTLALYALPEYVVSTNAMTTLLQGQQRLASWQATQVLFESMWYTAQELEKGQRIGLLYRDAAQEVIRLLTAYVQQLRIHQNEKAYDRSTQQWLSSLQAEQKAVAFECIVHFLKGSLQ